MLTAAISELPTVRDYFILDLCPSDQNHNLLNFPPIDYGQMVRISCLCQRTNLFRLKYEKNLLIINSPNSYHLAIIDWREIQKVIILITWPEI